jgi:hypothetical protein
VPMTSAMPCSTRASTTATDGLGPTRTDGRRTSSCTGSTARGRIATTPSTGRSSRRRSTSASPDARRPRRRPRPRGQIPRLFDLKPRLWPRGGGVPRSRLRRAAAGRFCRQKRGPELSFRPP